MCGKQWFAGTGNIGRLLIWPCLMLCSITLQASEQSAQIVDTDVVFVLDNSGSMRKNDPDRIVAGFVSSFAKRLPPTHKVSVLLYDSEARVIKSLRPRQRDVLTDLESSSLARYLDYTGQFTFSAEAIEAATRELKQGGRTGAEKIIIFLTDGVIDTGNVQHDIDKRAWLFGSLSNELVARGIRVFGLALGRNVDFEMVQTLSQKTGGDYYGVDSIDEVDNLFEKIIEAPTIRVAQSVPDITADQPQPTRLKPALPRSLPSELLPQPDDELAAEPSIPPSASVSQVPAAPDTSKPADQELASPGIASQPPIQPSATTTVTVPAPSSGVSENLLYAAFGFFVLAGMVVLLLVYRMTRNVMPQQAATQVVEMPVPKKDDVEIPGACLEVPAKITGGEPQIVELQEVETWFGSNASGSDFLMDVETISAVHFRIVFVEKSRSFEVVDSSSNGTWILKARSQSRTPVKLTRGERVPLADGDRLVLPGYGMDAAMSFRLTSSGQDDRAAGATMLFGGHSAFFADDNDKFEIENYSSVSVRNGTVVVSAQPSDSDLALIEIVDAENLLGVDYRLVIHVAGISVNDEAQTVGSQVVINLDDVIRFEHASGSRTFKMMIENEYITADSFISSPEDEGLEPYDPGAAATVVGRKPALPENAFLDVDANEYRDGGDATVMMTADTKCHAHPKVEAISNCSVCGDALCSFCNRRVDDIDYCDACLAADA